mmetsp:Transcript_24463/g.46368  ORF Transcript_24463/g.46368 Transcript_24463/m.46368 type:complete len:234 (-) Transcript_24463:304-1005(-)
MSIFPILGCILSRCFCFSFFSPSLSKYACRIDAMPVASIKSGSCQGGFSIPRLPCKNLRFWHQWRGTGTELRVALSPTSKVGSMAVVSQISTTSGRGHFIFSSAIRIRCCIFFFFFDSFFSSSSSPSLSSSESSESSPSSLVVAFSSFVALSSSPAPSPSTSPSCANWNFSNIALKSAKMGLSSSSSAISNGASTYSTSTSVALSGSSLTGAAAGSGLGLPAAFAAFFLSRRF